MAPIPKFNEKKIVEFFCIYRRSIRRFAKQKLKNMFVHPDARLNQFIDVKIPSCEELFNQFGYKKVSGHADNLKGEKFETPSNLHGISQQDRINLELAYLQQEVSSYQRSSGVAVKAEDSAETTAEGVKEETAAKK